MATVGMMSVTSEFLLYPANRVSASIVGSNIAGRPSAPFFGRYENRIQTGLPNAYTVWWLVTSTSRKSPGSMPRSEAFWTIICL